MYHQFNIQQLYVLPTQCIYVWISEQTAIISLYSINWPVCITETECVYCAVRTGYLNVVLIQVSLISDLPSRRLRCYHLMWTAVVCMRQFDKWTHARFLPFPSPCVFFFFIFSAARFLLVPVKLFRNCCRYWSAHSKPLRQFARRHDLATSTALTVWQM